MKILHVIPSISRRRGGPSVAALEMVAALRDRGVDARILTTNDDGPGLLQELPIGTWSNWEGVPVLAFSRWSPPLKPLREFAISLAFNRWLAAHLKDFDLLHAHAIFSWPSTSAMAQARRAGVPYALSTIGQLCRWSLGHHSLRKRLLLHLIERRNLEGAASLHFTTSSEQEEASDLGLPTPSFVLPLGVHLPGQAIPVGHKQADQHARKAPCRFLFLSRLHPKKQLENLLDALALLRGRQPNASWLLQIAGDGDPSYLSSLRQRARRLQIDEHLQWLGYVEGERKWHTLDAADWFVLPSASENFGIAAIEALAAGTPVILSTGVAVAEAITAAEAGRLCDPEPYALSLVLEESLAGPPAAMRAAAIDLAATAYGWPAIAARLETTYASLLLEHNRSRDARTIENGAHNTRPEPT
jgi:glycosyltransferase involved in cell wall biosynthesis